LRGEIPSAVESCRVKFCGCCVLWYRQNAHRAWNFTANIVKNSIIYRVAVEFYHAKSSRIPCISL